MVVLETHIEGVHLLARGKVRDIYDLGDQLLFIASDRISAFDVVLPNGIPDKGRVLTGISMFWFEMMSDLVPHHVISADVGTYPEVLKQIKLAVQDCGRRLGSHVRRGKRLAEAEKKQDYIKSYIHHIGEALREILGLTEKREKQIIAKLTDTLERSRKF